MNYDIILNFSRTKFLVHKTSSKVIVTGKQSAWYNEPNSLKQIILDTTNLSDDFSEEQVISGLMNYEKYNEIIKSLENIVNEKIKKAFIKSIRNIYNNSKITCVYNDTSETVVGMNHLGLSNMNTIRTPIMNTNQNLNMNPNRNPNMNPNMNMNTKVKNTKGKSSGQKTNKKCKSCHKKCKNKKKKSCSSSDSSSSSDSDSDYEVCCNYLTRTRQITSFPNLSIGNEVLLLVGTNLCYTQYNSVICTGQTTINCGENVNGGFKGTVNFYNYSNLFYPGFFLIKESHLDSMINIPMLLYMDFLILNLWHYHLQINYPNLFFPYFFLII
jgi:hypothetical protein